MIYEKINIDNNKKIINSDLTQSLDQDEVVFSNDNIIIAKNLYSMNKKIISRINGKINKDYPEVKVVFDKYLLCRSLSNYTGKALFDFSLNELKKSDYILPKDDLIYISDNHITHIYNSDLELLIKVEYKKNKVYVYDSNNKLLKEDKGNAYYDTLLKLYNNSYIANKTVYINPRNYDIFALKKSDFCKVFQDKYLIEGKKSLKIDGVFELSDLNNFRTFVSDNFIFVYSMENRYHNMFINNNYEVINTEATSLKEVNSDTLIKTDLNGRVSIIDKKGQKKIDNLYDNISYSDGIFKLNLNDKYALMDDKLNMITDYHDIIDILDKYFYRIIDNNSKYVRIFNKEKEIFSYLKSDSHINLYVKEHLLLIEKKDTSMVMNANGDIIINPVQNKIVLLSDKEILIDGHLFNLEEEYFNFKYEYYLYEYSLDRQINKKFLSNEERKRYIDRLEIIKNEAYKSLDLLNMEYENNKIKQHKLGR